VPHLRETGEGEQCSQSYEQKRTKLHAASITGWST
jgi:hypothetical protein